MKQSTEKKKAKALELMKQLDICEDFVPSVESEPQKRVAYCYVTLWL